MLGDSECRALRKRFGVLERLWPFGLRSTAINAGGAITIAERIASVIVAFRSAKVARYVRGAKGDIINSPVLTVCDSNCQPARCLVTFALNNLTPAGPNRSFPTVPER